MKKRQITIIASVIVFCCLFVFTPNNVFASTEGSKYYKNNIVYLYPSNATSTSNAQLYASWMISEFYDYDASSSSDTMQYAICKLLLRNTTSNDLIIPSSYIGITPNFTFQSDPGIFDVEYVSGQLIVDRVSTNGQFYFVNAPDHMLNSNIIVPAHGDICCVFKINFIYGGALTGFSITWNNPAIPFTPVVVAAGDALVSSYEEYLKWIYFRLNTIYDSLIDQAQTSTETVQTGEDTQTDIETIHGEEQTWFTGTETAIEGTGLSTFSFTGDAGTGITGVKDQFVDLWNHMGALIIVPVFALSLKLATTIIRHAPARKQYIPTPSQGRELSYGTLHEQGHDYIGVIWKN